MRTPNHKSQVLIVLITLSLISIANAADGKAVTKCEILSNTTDITNEVAVKTAKVIEKCLTITLDKDVKERLIDLIEKLPTSVQTAVFLKSVCIKNKRYNEYLYVPETGFQYDNETRRLFTWIGSPWHHDKGDFRLIPAEGDYFYIVSTNNHEYLFAAGNDYIVENQRRVFMWEPDWDDEREAFNDRQALWKLEPVNETGQVYIRNRQYGEHLYAAEPYEDSSTERRTVVTWTVNNECYGYDECIWEIEICSNEYPSFYLDLETSTPK